MSSFKKLNKADITSVSYAANKNWSFRYSNNPNDAYAVYYTGSNISFNISGPFTANNQYSSLIYRQINHLFYQATSSLLDTGSLMFNVDTYESASQNRPTASYFNYNINPALIKNFHTGAGEDIGVLSVNQDIYGSKILPHSFIISQSGLRITDDGNGNLISASVYVGNIFYAHGIAVITHQSYATSLFTGVTSSISFQNEHIIYENEVRCIVKESDYNLSYNPTLVTGSYESGSLRGFATSASFQPYVTTIGLYNDDNDLLMVAKLAKPIVLSSDTDMTFIVKYDT